MNKHLYGLFFLSVLFLSGCSVSESKIEKYVEKEHNVKAQVVEKGQVNTGNMGDVNAKLETEDGLQFDVFLEGYFNQKIVGDNFEIKRKLEKFNVDEYYTKEIKDKIKSQGFDEVEFEVIEDSGEAYISVLFKSAMIPYLSTVENMYESMKYLRELREQPPVPYGKVAYTYEDEYTKQYNRKFKDYGVDMFSKIQSFKIPESKDDFLEEFHKQEYKGYSIVESNELHKNLNPVENPSGVRPNYAIVKEKDGRVGIVFEAQEGTASQDPEKWANNVIKALEKNEYNKEFSKLHVFVPAVEKPEGHFYFNVSLDKDLKMAKEEILKSINKELRGE